MISLIDGHDQPLKGAPGFAEFWLRSLIPDFCEVETLFGQFRSVKWQIHDAEGKLKGNIGEPDCDVMQRLLNRASVLLSRKETADSYGHFLIMALYAGRAADILSDMAPHSMGP